MKAITLSHYGPVGSLRCEEQDTPRPGANEVHVRVHAAAVNDWDWCLVRGTPFYIRLLCGLSRPKVPIPGVDIAGVVDAVGSEVMAFRPGDGVYGDLSESGFGGFAEFVCARQDALARKPESLSFAEAAALPHAAVLAKQGLVDYGQLHEGQRVLINGAGGGVGTLGVQIARHLGAADITAVDKGSKRDTLLGAGFTHVIDYETEDFTRTGDTYDLILDTKTNRPLSAYARALTPSGRYITVGGETAPLFRAILAGPLKSRFSAKNFRCVAMKPNRDLDFITALADAGKLRPVTDRVYSLEQVPEALARFGRGEHHGKIIIQVIPDEER